MFLVTFVLPSPLPSTIIHVDVSDLQNFVNVALATAAGGEGDLANDKLSNLRTVASGFSALIYELKETTGFTELSNQLEEWAVLRDNPRLPEMLVSPCHLKSTCSSQPHRT